MDSFIDSTPLLNDGPAMRERLARDGYLFFHRLIDPAWIMALRREILLVLSRAGWLDPETNIDDARPRLPARHEGDDHFWEGYAAVLELEQLHQVPYNDAVLTMMRTLIGEEVLVHPRKMMRIVYPRALDAISTTLPHQDYRYVQGSADAFTNWIPLGNCPREMGGLRILRGSQEKGNARVIGGGGGHRCSAVDVDEHDPNWVTVDYQAGDVLVFHSLTVHAGMDNQTDRLRLSVDCRIQPARDPVSVSETTPPYQPHIPDWSELARNWASMRWIGLPDDVRITEFKDPASPDIVPPPSRFIAQKP